MRQETDGSKKDIKTEVNRDIKYDGLRAIGLLAIILAHTGTTDLIYQIRNFDVPMMILVSGTVYSMSSGINTNYWSYILSRLRRLVIPTWIFLSIYFIFHHIINWTTGKPFPYSSADLIKSYTLTWGVGYVWIIRIFVLVAIIIPLFLKIFRNIKNSRYFLLILLVIYVIYELIFLYYSHSAILKDDSYIQFIFQNYILNIIPYGCIAGLGLYLSKAGKRSILFLSGIFFILFISLAYFYNSNQFTQTQLYKYPPQIYYISYALFVSLLLYLFSKTNIFKIIFGSGFMLFIGRSSLWIYLWHILFLAIWDILKIPVSNLLPKYIAVYLFVLTLSILMTYIQRRIVYKLLIKYDSRQSIKKFLKETFLG